LDENIKKSEDPEDPREGGPLLKRKLPLANQSVSPISPSDALSLSANQHNPQMRPTPVVFPRTPPPPPQYTAYSRHKNRGIFWIVISAIATFLLLSLITLASILIFAINGG
jgi:hypothetical protein